MEYSYHKAGKQLKLFNDNGEARYPNSALTASHVAGIAEKIPEKELVSEYTVDTSKRRFETLEFILDTVSHVDQSKEGRALRDSILLNGVHALAQMKPVQFKLPRDTDSEEKRKHKRNHANILSNLKYYSNPLDKAQEETAAVDLYRPCRGMPTGKERINLTTALSGAVVVATKEASFGKCVKKWSKLSPRDAAQFPALMAYFDKVKRPAALEILRLRMEKASQQYNEGELDAEQVRAKITSALQKFFKASPVESDKSGRTTHAALMELMESPEVTTITKLYDPSDSQLIAMTAEKHCERFAKVYEQELLEHLPLLDKALGDVEHPLHKMAESFYCARWAQVVEELHNQIQEKTRLFPQPFKEQNQARY